LPTTVTARGQDFQSGSANAARNGLAGGRRESQGGSDRVGPAARFRALIAALMHGEGKSETTFLGSPTNPSRAHSGPILQAMPNAKDNDDVVVQAIAKKVTPLTERDCQRSILTRS